MACADLVSYQLAWGELLHWHDQGQGKNYFPEDLNAVELGRCTILPYSQGILQYEVLLVKENKQQLVAD